MKSLKANNIHVIVAENGANAKKKLFEIMPANAEIFTSSSVTLNVLGITEEMDKSGHYNSVRAKMALMDRKTQNRTIEKLGSTPEYMIGSPFDLGGWHTENRPNPREWHGTHRGILTSAGERTLIQSLWCP